MLIEAVADPTPPEDPGAEEVADMRFQMKQLLSQMENMSEREALDQVYRRLTLYLCGPCYMHWIEHPTG